MRDIARKNTTDRYALAQAVVRTSLPAEQLLELARADKGDPLSMARVAGIFAVKDTPRLIPLCHHITILHADCRFEVGTHEIRVLVEARTIGRTGVEVETMTGASIAAVTIYDVLKPHDQGVRIEEIALVEKRGGKTDHHELEDAAHSFELLILDDNVSSGGADVLKRALGRWAPDGGVTERRLSRVELLARLNGEQTDTGSIVFVVCEPYGNDGLLDDLVAYFDAEADGIVHKAREYMLERRPDGIFFRPRAGYIAQTLIVAFPADERGAKDVVDALFPTLLRSNQRSSPPAGESR